MRTVLLGLLGALCIGFPAYAADVISGSVSITASDPAQLGRLSRNGVQQDWTGAEAYPGTVNDAVSYNYRTVNAPFAANAVQDIYYDIDVDDDSGDLFASAYLDSYDPLDKSQNWLGDAGRSGNYFPGDPLYFDVVVPAGHSLELVFNSTSDVPTSDASYFVSAYSDTEYNENFADVSAAPEPSTWFLMLGGIAILGTMVRRARVRRYECGLAGG